MKRVIITGPTGTIGIALIQKLISENIEVTAVCHVGSQRISRIPLSPLVKIVECSLSELGTLPSLLNGQYEVFYHFGWDGTFGNSRNNMHGQNLNVKYTLDAVEVASLLGCHTFIGAGSQAEYGRFEGKLSAQTPTNPENGYGIAKLCAGQMSRILCSQKNIKHIWTRILSVYGPFDGDKTMVMSTIGKLLNHERPEFTKGEQQWDYLFSEDVALAMYLLGEKGISGKIYCIGGGTVSPLSKYIETIKDNIDKNAELGLGDVPYGEKQVMYLCADITDLQEDVGFSPQFTFEEGIRKTIDWYKQNM
ncbi:NAD-dependent epimerase/dehydratase family protein [[Clostridium] fimetarium]|uniref:Nucleoside-diphosphate-sugar epimerase n=1 Tax=[Clostridium] fimetarium TaxID=99656 RepID=A0A1I0P0Z5_9FIRM|nr:NAD(P)-dependent oxidoreductase [[Clostridium] fimetarium]SEW07828.1 Nucleoside-diphosphate-sugar epimerase [[Clostridium] fimetarium]